MLRFWFCKDFHVFRLLKARSPGYQLSNVSKKVLRNLMIEKKSKILQDDEIKVILVDRKNQSLGLEDKIKAHRKGQLHRAFSVMLYNPAGEMLIQRRALSKYHSPGLWANTCCGHPLPAEETREAARRRLWEELGFACDLQARTHVLYFLRVDHGMIEHEYVQVYEAEVSDACFALNPDEVMDVNWMTPLKIREDVKRNPQNYTRWFRLYLLKYFDKVFRQK
jgi:isopentenyl-diphosphate Delta-isomerase